MSKFSKILSIIIIIILILDFVFFARKQINTLVFWLILIIGAIFAWMIVPKMK